MNSTGKYSGRGAFTSGQGRGRRSLSPYPALGRGSRGRGRSGPTIRPNSSGPTNPPPKKKKKKKKKKPEKVEVSTPVFCAGRLANYIENWKK